MQRAASIEDFVSDPVGRHWSGASYVVWCASPTLCGSSHWGPLSERDIREVTRLFEIARHPSLQRFDVYMDNSAVELIHWGALVALTEYLRSRLAEWGRRIRKQAVVMPSGIVAALLAGVVPLIGPTYPMRFHSSRGEALEWLERDDAHPRVDEVEALVAEARGLPPLVRELRDYLDGALVDATLEAAARKLGRSPRSLQRDLRQAKTQFAVELTRARVRNACTMLAHSDDRVEEIALRVGCLSSSRLAAVFRREVGETPMRYRARHREG